MTEIWSWLCKYKVDILVRYKLNLVHIWLIYDWYCFCKGRRVSVPEIPTFVIFSIQLSRVQTVSHLSSNIPNLWCVSILHLKLICSTIYEQTKSIYMFLEFLINILYQAQFYLTSFKLDKPNFFLSNLKTFIAET